MKLGEKFKKMTDSERRKYAAKKLSEYEKNLTSGEGYLRS